MIDINEILAQFFQKRPEPDADGFFQYLLQEMQASIAFHYQISLLYN